MKKSILPLAAVLVLAACGADDETGGVKVLGGILTQLTQAGGSDPDWSPDGDEIVYAQGQNLWLISAAGGEPTQLTSLPGREFNPRWHPSPGTRRIVFANSGSPESYNIFTLDIGGGEPVEVYASNRSIAYPSFARDASKIVYVTALKGKGIMVLPAGGDQPTEMINSNGWTLVLCAHASPAGDEVCFVDLDGSDGSVWSISIGGGQPTLWARFTTDVDQTRDLSYAAFSRDGSKLILLVDEDPYISQRSLLYLPGIQQPVVHLTEPRREGDFAYPNWSPDGGSLVTGHDGQLWILKLTI